MFDKRVRIPYIGTMKKPAKPRPRKVAIIGIRTTQEVKDAATEVALSERRSISQWIEGLILDAIIERQKRRGGTA